MKEKQTTQEAAQGTVPAKKQSQLQRIIEQLPAEVRLEAAHAVELKQIINSPTPKSWIKKHPKGYQYIPFDKVMTLLNVLFKKHEICIISYQQILNSVVVHCRIKLVNYDNSTLTVDGIGAAPMHTAKGSSPMAHEKMLVDAVQLAAPAAYTYAVKNAMRKVGKIFGSDLEVEDPIDFSRVNSIDVEQIKGLQI